MEHPNCAPSENMVAVLVAAGQASKRNTFWVRVSPLRIRGTSGFQNRKLIEFDVNFGRTTHRIFLSSYGVLFQQAGDGFIPVNLACFTTVQLQQLRHTLDAIAPARSPQMS